MSRKLKISFDVDGTLTIPEILKFSEEISKNKEVFDIYIITTRPKTQEDKNFVKELTKNMNISDDKMYFCAGTKSQIISMLGIDIHFDDDFIEHVDIKTNTKCLPILIGSSDISYPILYQFSE